MDTIIFDTETTGLLQPAAAGLKAQPEIIEIYCLKINHDLEVITEFESLCKPSAALSGEITAITGITNDMLKDEPEFADIWEGLAEFFLGTEVLVAHNLPFDRSMLANELSRCNKVLNFPWPQYHICTVEKSMKYEQRRMNLTKLHEHLFNQGFPNAHRAKNDVMPLYRCFKEMVKRGDIKL